MATAGDDLTLSLQQSLSPTHVHLQSRSALPRVVPSGYGRSHPFAFLLPSTGNSYSVTRMDLLSNIAHPIPSEIPYMSKTCNCEAKSNAIATDKHPSTAEGVNNCSHVGGQQSKSKVLRKVKSGPQGANDEPPDGLNSASCRYDSSLGLLTGKFISLIQEAKDGILDLNIAADVLEAEVKTLYDEECRLDECIRVKQEILRALKCDKNHWKSPFFMEEDIMSLPCFKNSTVIAIKAPHASSIKVPDPDEDFGFSQRHFRLIVRSSTGPIDLYLLSKREGDIMIYLASPTKSLHSSALSGGRFIVNNVYSFNDQNNQEIAPNVFNSMVPKVSGIQKIFPSDCNIDNDYWFRYDQEVSATVLWGTD